MGARTDGLLRGACYHCASAIALVAGAPLRDPLARNDGGEFRQRLAVGQPDETFIMPRALSLEQDCVTVEGPATSSLSKLSNDNAKFYLRNIVTSGSKSCLMGAMGDSYKFSK